MSINEKDMAVIKRKISQAQAEILNCTGLNVKLVPRLSNGDMTANLKVLYNNMCERWGVTLKWVSDKSRAKDRPMMRKLLWMAGRVQYPVATYNSMGSLTGVTNHVTVLRGIVEGHHWLQVKDAKFMIYYELVKHYFDDPANQ
jgi:hypothetical protein